MNPLIKQRLVGTIVLVALGIVFWPLIFDAPEVPDPIVLQPTSDKPVVDRTPISTPQSFEAVVKKNLPDLPTIESEAQVVSDENTRTEVDAARLEALRGADEVVQNPEFTEPGFSDDLIDSAGLPVFWILQVAAVSSSDSADKLVARLEKKGYRAFSTDVPSDNGLYRVQIGPNVDRARLMQIKPDIDEILAVDSQVQRFVQ